MSWPKLAVSVACIASRPSFGRKRIMRNASAAQTNPKSRNHTTSFGMPTLQTCFAFHAFMRLGDLHKHDDHPLTCADGWGNSSFYEKESTPVFLAMQTKGQNCKKQPRTTRTGQASHGDAFAGHGHGGFVFFHRSAHLRRVGQHDAHLLFSVVGELTASPHDNTHHV